MKASDFLSKPIPGVDQLIEEIDTDPDRVLAGAFPPQETGFGSRAIVVTDEQGRLTVVDPGREVPLEERKRLLEAGRRALEKVRQDPNADLTEEEAFAFKAVVHMVIRPAILVQQNDFASPPVGWEILNDVRLSIQDTLMRVGRINLFGHPSLEYGGTGFLVAENAIMTNRHVAKLFCEMDADNTWKFVSRIAPSIDWLKEYGGEAELEFDLERVIGIHDTYDLALIQVTPNSRQGTPLPAPLALASEPPSDLAGRKVYTVGYPAFDPASKDFTAMLRIFSRVFNYKRLQPGEILEVFDQKSEFTHDCSTLGGNSGSCVIDLETNQVIGLHYGGIYFKANYAVALWQLTDDPLLKAAGVNFE